MKMTNDMTEWLYSNLDLIEECKENNLKPVILIAGASSSGKSYMSKIIANFLKERNYRIATISTDDYNSGLARDMFTLVNRKYYHGTLKNTEYCIEKIKEIIINSEFKEKFCDKNIKLIRNAIGKYVGANINEVLAYIKYEFENINFDRKELYNLDEVSSDLKDLIDGKKILRKEYSKKISERVETNEVIDGSSIDVILVEGIYALTEDVRKKVNPNNLICNFIECDSKNLFLRRVIRDVKITGQPKSFIIKNYFKYVTPEYFKTILPTKEYADIILQNNMKFEELRTGEIETQQKYKIDKREVQKLLKKSIIIKKEHQIDTFFGKKGEKNILRLRECGNDKNEMTPYSLVYKSSPKLRKDKSLIRQVHVLADEKDLKYIFKNKEELENCFSKIGIEKRHTIKKTRLLVNYLGHIIKLDSMGGNYYMEIDRLEKQDEYLANIEKSVSSEFINENE